MKGFFDSDERCYLQITTFARFINFNALSTERMTAQKLSTRLTRLGFIKVEVAARQGEKVISVRMYVSPAKFFDSLSGDNETELLREFHPGILDYPQRTNNHPSFTEKRQAP